MKPLAANSLLQNRYLIIHHIGKGGMGEVYLSVDQRLGNPVALKRTVFRDDAMMWDAFEREARILARLRHPVLPKVSDHFSEKEEQYLVMEYISGDDLSKRLDTAQKPFPLQWVLYWADELLDALSYLHTHEPPIIHRDIKPQNLKLTNENHVVLLDFGLAKNSVAKKTQHSSSGSLVGYTPHYAPIEQIRGTGTNPRSDIYSLSATLYQLMTGTVPLDALTRAESVIGGSGDSLPSPTDIVPEISPEISAVILHGMALNSEQRFSDAKEMQKTLREAYSVHQQRVAAGELFDGAETLVPEAKSLPPEVSVSGPKAAAHIFTNADIDVAAAQNQPPVTLAAESLKNGANGSPENGAINVPDFAATIPADQWSPAEGETQGFTHSEMRRSTIDEEAFQKFGFDAEGTATGSTDYDLISPTQFIDHENNSPETEAELAAAAATAAQQSEIDKNPPIRPITKPLDPAAKPVKPAKPVKVKKASSGLGLKLIGAAAVLCFMVAAAGAGVWYAVTNNLITIPGFEQTGSQTNNGQNPADEKKPDVVSGGTNTDPGNTSQADKGEANSTAPVNATVGDPGNQSTVNSTVNSGDRKPAQTKPAQKPKTAPDKGKPKGPGAPTDILQ